MPPSRPPTPLPSLVVVDSLRGAPTKRTTDTRSSRTSSRTHSTASRGLLAAGTLPPVQTRAVGHLLRRRRDSYRSPSSPTPVSNSLRSPQSPLSILCLTWAPSCLEPCRFDAPWPCFYFCTPRSSVRRRLKVEEDKDVFLIRPLENHVIFRFVYESWPIYR
jgi:hypothetical protein